MGPSFVAAADGGNNSSASNSLTFSYTVGTGANRLLVVYVGSGANNITGVTYAGVAMTLAAQSATGNNSIYYLLNPPSGSNSVVITAATTQGLFGAAADYTGAAQSGQPDATGASVSGANVSTFTSSITPVTPGGMAVCVEGGFDTNSDNLPPTTTAFNGFIRRAADAQFGSWGLFDSVVPYNTYNLTTSRSTTSSSITHVKAVFAPIVPTPTTGPLLKPNGFPTMVANALSSGMLLYAFDTGTGAYSLPYDSGAPLHKFDPPNYITPGSPNVSPSAPPNDPLANLNVAGTTLYGKAVLWPGPNSDSIQPGGGSYISLQTSDPLRTAVDLANAGLGAAFTMFATFIQTSAATSSTAIICGRGQNLDAGNGICTLQINTSGLLGFSWSAAANGSSPQTLNYTTAISLNTLYTAVVTCVNTAAGVTTITIYLNGTQVAQATGQTMHDVTDGNSFNEDQLQVGNYFHSGAGQMFGALAGSVYQFGIANRAWTLSDTASLAATPYQLLQFPSVGGGGFPLLRRRRRHGAGDYRFT